MVHVAVERRETLLPVAVDVVGQLVTGLLRRLEEGLEQWAVRGAAFQHQRAFVAAPPAASGQAGFHLLEVRQAVRIVPGLHARVGGPALVVQGVAALEDHPVDAAGAAQHFAAGVVDPAPVHERLGLGLVLPVVQPVPDRVGQRGRHVNEHVPRVIRAARFEHQHLVGRVSGEPAGPSALPAEPPPTITKSYCAALIPASSAVCPLGRPATARLAWPCLVRPVLHGWPCPARLAQPHRTPSDSSDARPDCTDATARNASLR